MAETPAALDLRPELTPQQVLDRLDGVLPELAAAGGYKGSVETFVPGAGEVFGVRVPQLRKLGGLLYRAFRRDKHRLVAVARACWARGSREHRLVALFALQRLRTLSPHERWQLGREFLGDVRDWETCDQLCSALLGPALAAEAGLMEDVEALGRSQNFWFQRGALVASVSLRRSKLGADELRILNERTLALCAGLLGDPEPYIRKAVDWALRELLKRDYDLGRDFLFDQAGRNPVSPAITTLKLASKKLTVRDRARFTARLRAGDTGASSG